MNIQDIVGEIKKTKKYGHISDATLERICATELPKYKKQKEAVKAVKNQLHIMHGAFFPEKCHQSAISLISGSEKHGRELSGELLALHPSTRERLPDIEDFFAFLHPYIKNADAILDIGCGFNPCSFPWMGAKENVKYTACDIDSLTLGVIRAYGEREGIGFGTFITDIALGLPPVQADITFAFKLLPVLEQQRKGLGIELLTKLSSRLIVATYPIKSLSGKEKGMASYYSNYFESALPDGIEIAAQATIGNELVYVVRKERLA